MALKPEFTLSTPPTTAGAAVSTRKESTETLIALAASTPDEANRATKAASRTPKPPRETGMRAINWARGTVRIQRKNGTCTPTALNSRNIVQNEKI
jgi:hypothetical protein